MPEIVLGIHTGHDRGAAIIVDNVIQCAISQERLDRNKHSMSYGIPYQSIDAVLAYCNLSIDDISCVGYSSDSVEASEISSFIQEMFFSRYNCKKIPFYAVEHHKAHAETVFNASNFDESLILIADGGGDYCGRLTEAESLFIAKNNHVYKLESRLQNPPMRKLIDKNNHIYPLMPKSILNDEISIGRKYEQITYMLGFTFGQAGKTMGLASYGHDLVDFPEFNDIDLSFSLKYKDILEELYIQQILDNKSYSQYLVENAENIAKTVQTYTEKIMISLVNGLVHKYGVRKLCLSGGLFLNCMMNHKILSSCDVDDIYVFPACGDDGQAIGAAINALRMNTNNYNNLSIDTPYIGLSYTNSEVKKSLDSRNIKYHYENDDNLAKLAATEISKGQILGIHRGRTEIGPRALCHRSILADATNPNMKDILNERVKHREKFRPFAPVVTYEDQFKIFSLKKDSPYMLFATEVLDEYRNKIPSVTHVDGTARVQSVQKEKEPFIYAILKEFEQIKGIPVILNTSFNVAGEPIVETPDDTIQTFLSAEIDTLIIGNYIIYKSEQHDL